MKSKLSIQLKVRPNLYYIFIFWTKKKLTVLQQWMTQALLVLGGEIELTVYRNNRPLNIKVGMRKTCIAIENRFKTIII